jgi:hypothetical protein
MQIAELFTQLSHTSVEVSLIYHSLAWRKPDKVDCGKKCEVSVNHDEAGPRNISLVMRK